MRKNIDTLFFFTFCVAIPPIFIAPSVALLATFIAEDENMDQLCNKKKNIHKLIIKHF